MALFLIVKLPDFSLVLEIFAKNVTPKVASYLFQFLHLSLLAGYFHYVILLSALIRKNLDFRFLINVKILT